MTRHQGKRLLLCYEEAIGFSCGEDSFDKVGPLALLMLLLLLLLLVYVVAAADALLLEGRRERRCSVCRARSLGVQRWSNAAASECS